mmetsp:Transcript_54322/g.87749  ORF Transcript_54322/g.87749 Transcript_54322/m.87749 type:complete len:440 (+) Transcript_54322:51-1370(+)
MTAASSYPTAPPGWHRKQPARTKAYEDTRPGDFESFKELPPRDGLLRLIIGRLSTADGQDMQDDFTVPIEKQFMSKPLEWILRYAYCPARGIPTDTEREGERERDSSAAKLSVKFMLPEAGAGLGWLDVSQSPRSLKLKDSDIVQVLVTRSEETLETSLPADEVASWEPSWQEALVFFAEVRSTSMQDADCWLPKTWHAIAKHMEDDNVVTPAFGLLAEFADAGSAQRQQILAKAGPGCEPIRFLLDTLERHSGSNGVQVAGWKLLVLLAKEHACWPRFVDPRARALAQRLVRAVGESAPVASSASEVLRLLPQRRESVPAVPADQAIDVAKPAETATAVAGQSQAVSVGERWSKEAAQTAVKLERAMHTADPMSIEKALLKLISKMRNQDFDYRTFQEAGMGKLLGELVDFDGEKDIRILARKAISEAAKLQLADYVR